MQHVSTRVVRQQYPSDVWTLARYVNLDNVYRITVYQDDEGMSVYRLQFGLRQLCCGRNWLTAGSNFQPTKTVCTKSFLQFSSIFTNFSAVRAASWSERDGDGFQRRAVLWKIWLASSDMKTIGIPLLISIGTARIPDAGGRWRRRRHDGGGRGLGLQHCDRVAVEQKVKSRYRRTDLTKCRIHEQTSKPLQKADATKWIYAQWPWADFSPVLTYLYQTANGSTLLNMDTSSAVIHVHFTIFNLRRHTICPLSLHLSQPAYFSVGYCNSQSDISAAQRPAPLRTRYTKRLKPENNGGVRIVPLPRRRFIIIIV